MATASTERESSAAEEPDFLEHLRRLKLRTVEEYRAWCDRHGFSRRIKKSWRDRLKERAHLVRNVSDASIARTKLESRKPERIIEAIVRGEHTPADFTRPHLIAICRELQRPDWEPAARANFGQLLKLVIRQADFFRSGAVIPEFGPHEHNTFLAGLAALAKRSADWIRPLAAWRSRTHNARRQFTSLANHCFAKWPVPTFMDAAWFQPNAAKAAQQQDWYLHLGRGENLRTANLPITFTKRMAHHFMQAPADLSIEAALRWGQVFALSGNERVARAVIGTRLLNSFDADEFWQSAIRFLITNPMLAICHFGPICDFVHQQKFVPVQIMNADGVIETRPPPQPDFSFKGRTPASLVRQTFAWHHALGHQRDDKTGWPASGIKPLLLVEGNADAHTRRVWTTVELLSTSALVDEGRRMKHCVASYARACAHGDSSIWSLAVADAEGNRRVLTIEVQRTSRLICQAKGVRNANPGEKHLEILRRWGAMANLTLAAWV